MEQTFWTEMGCLELSPFKACGLAGSCLNNGTQEFCSCDRGWSQSKEMTLFFMSDDELSEGTHICNSNQGLLLTLYILILLLATIILLFVVTKVKRSNLSRASPLILNVTLQISLASYRLARSEDALYGKDVFFTFLAANVKFSGSLTAIRFNDKYLDYVKRRINFDNSRSEETLEKHQRINCALLLMDWAFSQVCWIVILGDEQQTKGIIALRVSWSILAVRALYASWIARLLFQMHIRDMKKLIEFSADRQKNAMTLTSIARNKFVDKIKMTVLPRTVQTKKAVIQFALLHISFMLLCACWNYAFLFYGILFPLQLLIWDMALVVATKASVEEQYDSLM